MKKLLSLTLALITISPVSALAANIGTSNTSTNTKSYGLNSGLVGYWTFDGKNTNWNSNTTSDVSGQGNDGSLINTSTTTSPVQGKIGQALNLKGTNDYVALTTTASIKTNVFTYSAWIKKVSDIDYHIILSGNNADGFQFRTNVTTGALELDYTGHVVIAVSTAAVPNNVWTFVTATYDAFGNANLYINGVNVKSATNAQNPPFTTINIGRDSGSSYFNGRIDDVRIYNRALSPNEVKQLYTQGSATIAQTNTSTDTKTFGLNSGLVGYWPLDGKNTNWNTNVTSDVSGQGNNGSLINTSTTTTPVQGKIGQGLDMFPRRVDQDSYINVGDPGSGALDFAGDFSIDFWMKGYGYVNQGSSVNTVLVKQNLFSGFQTAGYSFTIGSTMTFSIGNGSTAFQVAQSTNTTADGKWHHYVGVRSGSTMYMYVDGVQQTPTTGVTGSAATASGLLFGDRGDGAQNLNGVLDDVRIYNRALVPTEVKQLYNQGAATIAQSNTSTDSKTFGLNSGLLGYWPLDGKYTNWIAKTTADVSGNANTGAIVNMSTTSAVQGKVGQALKFVSANGTAVNMSTLSNVSRITVSYWMKESSTPVSLATMLGRGWDGTGLPFFSDMRGGLSQQPTFGTYIGSGTDYVQANSSLTVGRWYHIVGTFDGTAYRIYINGVLDNTLVDSTPPYSSSATFSLGWLNGIGRSFDGLLDDVRVYNRALSANEVAQLYASEK